MFGFGKNEKHIGSRKAERPISEMNEQELEKNLISAQRGIDAYQAVPVDPSFVSSPGPDRTGAVPGVFAHRDELRTALAKRRGIAEELVDKQIRSRIEQQHKEYSGEGK